MADNPVSLSELDAALDELLAQEVPPWLDLQDITIMRLQERAECGPKRARTIINKWVEGGKLEYLGKRRETKGHAVDAWRLAERKVP